MKKQFLFLCGCACLWNNPSAYSAPLAESTFTDIVKDVNVISAGTKASTPAKLKDLFKAPNLVRTGPNSRAELTAPDQTITRVGANTVFSFSPTGRDINLEQGSVLFHSPSGRGGGTIKSGGASAAVSGTTLMVGSTPAMTANTPNGFKVIMLEGKGKVTLGNGKFMTLSGGQMVYVLPGQGGFSKVFTINLPRLIQGSSLVKGFMHDLPSLPLIQQVILKQTAMINQGMAKDTGIAADTFAASQTTPPSGYAGTGANTFSGDPNTTQVGGTGSMMASGNASATSPLPGTAITTPSNYGGSVSTTGSGITYSPPPRKLN